MRTMKDLCKIFLTAAFAVAAVSCSKEPIDVQPKRVVEEAENTETPSTEQSAVSGAYQFSIKAGHGQPSYPDATRAYLEVAENPSYNYTYTYSWDPGDQTRLTITPQGSTSATLSTDIVMTSQNTARAVEANFSGTVTEAELNALSAADTFDYYSYYPNNPNITTSFPNISFSIPATVTLTPDVLTSAYAPMVAKMENQPAIIYDKGQGLGHGDLVHFDYNHIMSYIAIEMDVKLLAADIEYMALSSTNTNVRFGGTYTYNMLTETLTRTSGGSNSIRINVSGGLDVGNEVIYLPVAPTTSWGNYSFTLSFNTGSSVNKYTDITFTGPAALNRGEIHRLRAAPVVKYTGNETFTVTKTGYYYIEAWGGNGGKGSTSTDMSKTGGAGGVSQKIEGYYNFTEGDVVGIYLGSAGAGNNTETGSGAPSGGTNGSTYGVGGAGGAGGGNPNSGGRGGGGGAATLVFLNGTGSANIRLASGGGGGGGGATNTDTQAFGGAAGDGGSDDSNGGDGSNAGIETTRGGGGGYGNGTGGSKGDSGGTAGGSGTTTGNGGAGAKGTDGTTILFVPYGAGAGGGGGGGGWNGTNGGGSSGYGGGGAGGGGDRTRGADRGGAGGGGAGGGSCTVGNVILPVGKTPPTPGSRSSTTGYAIITYVR